MFTGYNFKTPVYTCVGIEVPSVDNVVMMVAYGGHLVLIVQTGTANQIIRLNEV